MTAAIESALLRQAIRAHEQALKRLDGFVADLSSSQANWRPAPKSWSVAECIEHLNQTLGTYMEKMAPAIGEARRQGRAGSEPYSRGTLMGWLLVSLLEKPSKKLPAPGVFRPGSSELEMTVVARTLRERISRFVGLAEEADGLALGSIRIPTPVSRWIRLSLAQAFEVHTLHTPRHLAQAERVALHQDFPEQ